MNYKIEDIKWKLEHPEALVSATIYDEEVAYLISEIEVLQREVEHMYKIAESWRQDYDILKARHEPEIPVLSGDKT